MIYTSYYGNYYNIAYKYSGNIYAISCTQPDYILVPNIRVLNPDYNDVLCIKKDKSYAEEYTKRYLSKLNRNKDKIKKILKDINVIDNDVVFLCYEKPGDFCHRHILARFIEEEFGVSVIEFKLGH